MLQRGNSLSRFGFSFYKGMAGSEHTRARCMGSSIPLYTLQAVHSPTCTAMSGLRVDAVPRQQRGIFPLHVCEMFMHVRYLLNTFYLGILHIVQHAGMEQLLKGQNLTVHPFTYNSYPSVQGTSVCHIHLCLCVHHPCGMIFQCSAFGCDPARRAAGISISVYRFSNSIQLQRSKAMQS